MNEILEQLYPEAKIGGFARCDHRVVFYSLVNELLRPDMQVLDYGAGRGKFDEVETGFKRDLTLIKGKVANVIGVDPDPVVLTNPEVDSGLVIGDDGILPLEDQSIDLVLSWSVFEHVEDAEVCAAELDRVLKPGGWCRRFCKAPCTFS